ncbi:MAG TPA: DUF5671 domain-containing protein [Anaerolineales bacterium]|nr:DUF5671 domain-containing protein [Anaerolineales bacterium]HNB36124.1 DUF5671 domain-containing protein [Anaerolineales bacterium]
MKTIRRLYFYAVAAISIEVVLWGIIGLLRSIFDAQDITNNASNLASALALILVGVPIFLVHWVWAQNVSSKDAEEHSASVRAVFLYGILLGTLIPVIQNLLAFINRTFLSTVNLSEYRAVVGGSQTWLDNLIAIVINLLIAAYFWNVLRSNWKSLTEPEGFAEIRRLYRFVWVLYGLLMAVYGVQQAISYAFSFPTNVLGEIGKETAVNAIALMVIGSPIWYYAWRLLQDALPDPDEKESYLRLGLLYLLTLGGVIVFLVSSGNLLYQILLQLLGEGQKANEFIRELGGPISVAIPFGVVWAYYGKWLNRQFSFDENLPRRASKQRLYFYILSFLGLASTVAGLLTLFTVLIDLLLGDTYISDSGLREPLSGALATLIVGLPVWWMTWRPMQAQALSEGDAGDHVRRSVIRKSYLYLALFASVIGGMVSAGVLVFTLINAVLGGDSTNVLKTVLNSLMVLIVFVVLLLYHLYALRKDGLSRADHLIEKQTQFHVLVFDQNGTFGQEVRDAFAKQASSVPVMVVNVNDDVPSDLKVDAVVLPGSLAVNTPEKVEAWLRSFNGSRLIVSDEAAGVFWMNDSRQAADSAKALAEGQDLRPQSSKRTTSLWTYVAYVFAALFACQLLFLLLTLGVSMVSGF